MTETVSENFEVQPMFCKRCGVELNIRTPSMLRFCFPCVRAVLAAWSTQNEQGQEAQKAQGES
jgi:hypothetical protein